MSSAVSAAFTVEEALVICRWIDDVCGDAVQLSAHETVQPAVCKQNLRQFLSSGGESLFCSFSRSGTREIAALQNMWLTLTRLHEQDSEKLEMVGKEIVSIECVLRKNALIPTEEAALTIGTARKSSGNLRQLQGDRKLDRNDAVAGDAANQSRNNRVELFLNEIERHMQGVCESLEVCRAQYTHLFDQNEHQKKELHITGEMEKSVVASFDRANSALEVERTLLAQEQAKWGQLQHLDVYEASEPGWGDPGCVDGGDDFAAARVLRASLTDAFSEYARWRTLLGSTESTHAVRFRHARQRLRDWQGMVEQMRCLHNQLCARTRVIGNIVERSALRLEAESELGSIEQLRKLNSHLLERSVKILGVGDGMRGSVNRAISGGDDSDEVPAQTLFANRAQIAPSTSNTEILSSTSLRQSSGSSTASPTVASSSVRFPMGSGSTNRLTTHQRVAEAGRHRDRQQRPTRQDYALLTCIQKWETSLVDEFNTLLAVCEKGIASISSSSSSSSSRTVFIQELRNILSER